MDVKDRATLDQAEDLAAVHHWDRVSRVDEPHVTKLELRRGDERLSLTAWDTGVIHCLHGQLATGQISSRQVNRQWNSNIGDRELTEMLAGPDRLSYSNNSGFCLLVKDGEVPQHWETYSNYTLHKLVPGVYPIELQTSAWQRVQEDPINCDARAYYAVTRIKTVELSRHYVNRVFTASSAHDEEVNQPSSIGWDCYAYQLPEKGQTKAMGNHYIIVPESFGGWR